MNQAVEQAVILAAGRGIRLGDQGTRIPKGFLRLGDTPIVEESLRRLRDAGIRKTLIVTGHLAERYEALAKTSGGFVETVYNERFADTGSLLSLLIAIDRLNADTLLLESDLIYEPRALRIVQDGPADAILLSGATGAGDEVFVESDDRGQLVAMSKDPTQLGNIAGELVGICRLSRQTQLRLKQWADTETVLAPGLEYEVDGLVAIRQRSALCCTVVPDLVWAEIDDAVHLERARKIVYPRIACLE
jgi:2-aminoethylphosphonate-pyruvate transaminase